jgi:hypothetical protein
MCDYEFQEEDYNLICPINNDVFEDPVKAEDSRTYDRLGIESWFQSLQQRGLPIVSPWTREGMGTRLVKDDAAAVAANRLREEGQERCAGG